MELSREENLTLNDVCCDVNRLLHDRKHYESLSTKRLIYRTLGGYWAPTHEGRERNKPENGGV